MIGQTRLPNIHNVAAKYMMHAGMLGGMIHIYYHLGI